MDEDNYLLDDKTKEILEILATYFVDIFYNGLYDESEKIRLEKNLKSLTESYKLSLRIYNNSLNDSENYKQILTKLIN